MKKAEEWRLKGLRHPDLTASENPVQTKFEYRNPKFETNSKFKCLNDPNGLSDNAPF